MKYLSSTFLTRNIKVHLLAIVIFTVVLNNSQAQYEYKPFKFQYEETTRLIGTATIESQIDHIVEQQKSIDDIELQAIKYWNASYPSYRWHQIMMQVSRAKKGHKNGGRVVILHLAIYDALVEVWKEKETHQTQAPYEGNSQVQKLARHRAYSSYICEWSAAAGAASEVISYYFPERKSYLDSLLSNFKKARLLTGLQLPSDIDKGISIGRNIAKQYIEYAKTDRTNKTWNGTVPKVDSLWSGNPGMWDPMKRQWKPLTLESPDQFRPSPPPSDWTADMEELRNFNANHQTSEIAWKWKSAPVWDDLLERKILEYDLGPMEAAFAAAVFHTARFDGMIAAWDGKYHYWGIRPFQYDPDFKPILVATPNFPGYPAGHTTVAGSIAAALSFLFPQDERVFLEMAKECSESRFEGGVHFRTDNEVGLEVGSKVGKQVISNFANKRRKTK